MLEGQDEKGRGEVKDMSPWCKSSSPIPSRTAHSPDPGNYLTTDVITKVVFSTSWNLLSSPLNHGVIKTSATIVRFLGVAHQSSLLYTYKLAIILFPGLVKSASELRKYTIDLMARSMEVRSEFGGHAVKDIFGTLLEAKDPESKTGEHLTQWDVRINSSNLLVAG